MVGADWHACWACEGLCLLAGGIGAPIVGVDGIAGKSDNLGEGDTDLEGFGLGEVGFDWYCGGRRESRAGRVTDCDFVRFGV